MPGAEVPRTQSKITDANLDFAFVKNAYNSPINLDGKKLTE